MLSRKFGIVIIAALVIQLSVYSANAAGISVTVNGQAVEFPDQQPVLDANNRTLVPVRAPMEAMGVDVSWDEAAQSFTLSSGEIQAVFTIGKDSYQVNGETKQMDTAPVVINERSVLPIRYAAEAFGGEVSWDETTQTVAITASTPASADPLPSYNWQKETGSVTVSGVMREKTFFVPAFKTLEQMQPYYIYAHRDSTGKQDYLEFTKSGFYYGQVSTEYCSYYPDSDPNTLYVPLGELEKEMWPAVKGKIHGDTVTINYDFAAAKPPSVDGWYPLSKIISIDDAKEWYTTEYMSYNTVVSGSSYKTEMWRDDGMAPIADSSAMMSLYGMDGYNLGPVAESAAFEASSAPSGWRVKPRGLIAVLDYGRLQTWDDDKIQADLMSWATSRSNAFEGGSTIATVVYPWINTGHMHLEQYIWYKDHDTGAYMVNYTYAYVLNNKTVVASFDVETHKSYSTLLEASTLPAVYDGTELPTCFWPFWNLKNQLESEQSLDNPRWVGRYIEAALLSPLAEAQSP